MHGHRISINISAPVVAEGIRLALQEIDGLIICPPGEDTAGDRDVLVIADPFTVQLCPEDARILGVTWGPVPPHIAELFTDTVTVFDDAETICGKVRGMLSPTETDSRCDDLSPREKEVILLIVKGLSNKEIASAINVSVNTVMTHRRNISNKLQIHSPAALTIFALTTGLVKMDEIRD